MVPCFFGMSKSVSRVLYSTVIYLGRTFLHGSSHVTESNTPGKRASIDAFRISVAPGGVYMAERSPARR